MGNKNGSKRIGLNKHKLGQLATFTRYDDLTAVVIEKQAEPSPAAAAPASE